MATGARPRLVPPLRARAPAAKAARELCGGGPAALRAAQRLPAGRAEGRGHAGDE